MQATMRITGDPGMLGGKDAYVQFLRGLAISAVVLIHVLPQADITVVVRPFLNFCVALFIFLSGYLTPRAKVENLKRFYVRRLARVVAPYIVWTVLYLALYGALTPLSFVKALLVGGAAGQMYYLVVYICLVIATPVIYKLLDCTVGRVVLYAITPVCLCVRYALFLTGMTPPHIEAFFGFWLIYYLAGLEWSSRVRPWFARHNVTCKKVACVALVFIAAQMLEGFIWLRVFGDYSIATSQMKLGTMLASLSVACVAMMLSDESRRRVAGCHAVVKLGDCSFGIYLSHMVFIWLWSTYTPFGQPWFLLEWAAVLVCSAFFVWACGRLLPKRLLGFIGFA